MPDVFRKAIDQIMRGPPPGPVHTDAPARPESFGWLRRADHDVVGGAAWERPDGEICVLPRPVLPADRPAQGSPAGGPPGSAEAAQAAD